MKKRWLGRIITLSVALLLVLMCSQSSLGARKKRAKKDDSSVGVKISDSQRPWAGMPWVTALVLTGGAVAIGMKNSGRTHRD